MWLFIKEKVSSFNFQSCLYDWPSFQGKKAVNLACLQQFQFGPHKSDHMTVTWFEDLSKCRPNDHFKMKPSDSWPGSWLMVILQHSATAPRTRRDFWWIWQKVDYKSLCSHFKQPIWQNYDCSIHGVVTKRVIVWSTLCTSGSFQVHCACSVDPTQQESFNFKGCWRKRRIYNSQQR